MKKLLFVIAVAILVLFPGKITVHAEFGKMFKDTNWEIGPYHVDTNWTCMVAEVCLPWPMILAMQTKFQ